MQRSAARPRAPQRLEGLKAGERDNGQRYGRGQATSTAAVRAQQPLPPCAAQPWGSLGPPGSFVCSRSQDRPRAKRGAWAAADVPTFAFERGRVVSVSRSWDCSIPAHGRDAGTGTCVGLALRPLPLHTAWLARCSWAACVSWYLHLLSLKPFFLNGAEKDITEQYLLAKQRCLFHPLSRTLDVALAVKVHWLLHYRESLFFCAAKNFSGASFEAFIEIRGCSLLQSLHGSLQHFLKALTLDIVTNASSLFISLHLVIDVRPGQRVALGKRSHSAALTLAMS